MKNQSMNINSGGTQPKRIEPPRVPVGTSAKVGGGRRGDHRLSLRSCAPPIPIRSVGLGVSIINEIQGQGVARTLATR